MLLAVLLLHAGGSAATRYPMPAAGGDLIGELVLEKASRSETLLDIARRHDIGQNEIRLANPEVDRWLPEEGSLAANRWVANIPYSETRKYVQRVLAYAAIYDWRMQQPITPLSVRSVIVAATVPSYTLSAAVMLPVMPRAVMSAVVVALVLTV